ncbi:hypothetical protein [Polyangium sp. 6x1]|uniref:hypothetical protein n=1 Tax=Polyangium sp. 6x1 TaxID=3042689 RepID=UPI002482D246|nr:hypothetical protein [Polyangium sp. 6x1]MDI1444623.1 hypothetical protein [Polyangium sp. 6x1]
MPLPDVKTRWFSVACKVARTPDELLREVLQLKRAARCSFRRIANVHPVIGRLIDELRAPLSVAKRIAHAPPAEQWRRAEQELAALVERREGRGLAGLYERDLLAELQAATVPQVGHGAARRPIPRSNNRARSEGVSAVSAVSAGSGGV